MKATNITLTFKMLNRNIYFGKIKWFCMFLPTRLNKI